MENINRAIPTSSMAVDPNALVNPNGGKTQQLQANPNAMINPDGRACFRVYSCGLRFWAYASGLWFCGTDDLCQFSVPLTQNLAGHVPPPVVTAVLTTHVALVAPAMPHVPTTHAERPEKFNRKNFKQWQQKMLFNLTTLNLSRYLIEETPMLTAESDTQMVFAVDAWKHSDYICRNYVLNGLTGLLYDVYSSKVTSKDLQESLDRKYKTEDVGAKKWIVGRFLDDKMVDSKTIDSQVQELQMIIHEIHAERMGLMKSFQVATVMEKMPPGWKDFQNYQ